jgi:hypothetical protein
MAAFPVFWPVCADITIFNPKIGKVFFDDGVRTAKNTVAG